MADESMADESMADEFKVNTIQWRIANCIHKLRNIEIPEKKKRRATSPVHFPHSSLPVREISQGNARIRLPLATTSSL